MSHLWVYLLLAVFIALEGAATILLAAGAASAGFLNPLAVFCAAILGNLIADVLWYTLGYYSRIDSLLYRFKRLGVTAEKLDLLKRIIRHDVIRLLVFAKLANWMTVPALIAVGVARVSWKRWFPLILASDLLIAIVLVPLGYFMASSFLQIQKGMGYVALGFTSLFILVTILYASRLLSRKDLAAAFENQDQS